MYDKLTNLITYIIFNIYIYIYIYIYMRTYFMRKISHMRIQQLSIDRIIIYRKLRFNNNKKSYSYNFLSDYIVSNFYHSYLIILSKFNPLILKSFNVL